MFSGVAPRYDLLNHLLSFGIDTSWRRRTADRLLGLCQVDGPVLDVCTGTGDLAFALRKRERQRQRGGRQAEGPYRDLIGVDFVPEMLAIAEKKRKKQPPERVEGMEFREGDALELPFEDGRFALVTVAFGLRNTAEPDRALREMVRVCKPGGIVAVLEFTMPTAPVLATSYRWYFHRILPLLGRWVSNDRSGAYRYLPESVENFAQGEALTELMASTGLERLERVSMTFSTVTLYYGSR